MRQHFEPVVDLSERDIQLVEQSGYIDLRLAYSTGIVEGSLESTEIESNGIEDPSSIIGRPDDVFAVERSSAAMKAAAAVPPGEAPSDGSPGSGASPDSPN